MGDLRRCALEFVVIIAIERVDEINLVALEAKHFYVSIRLDVELDVHRCDGLAGLARRRDPGRRGIRKLCAMIGRGRYGGVIAKVFRFWGGRAPSTGSILAQKMSKVWPIVCKIGLGDFRRERAALHRTGWHVAC